MDDLVPRHTELVDLENFFVSQWRILKASRVRFRQVKLETMGLNLLSPTQFFPMYLNTNYLKGGGDRCSQKVGFDGEEEEKERKERKKERKTYQDHMHKICASKIIFFINTNRFNRNECRVAKWGVQCSRWGVLRRRDEGKVEKKDEFS